jgi:hypothetical protein
MSPSGKGFAVLERMETGKEMLVRIVAMLTKLVERFDPDHSIACRPCVFRGPISGAYDARAASALRMI